MIRLTFLNLVETRILSQIDGIDSAKYYLGQALKFYQRKDVPKKINNSVVRKHIAENLVAGIFLRARNHHFEAAQQEILSDNLIRRIIEKLGKELEVANISYLLPVIEMTDCRIVDRALAQRRGRELLVYGDLLIQAGRRVFSRRGALYSQFRIAGWLNALNSRLRWLL